MRCKIIYILFSLLSGNYALAQVGAEASDPSPVRTFTRQQYDSYLKGEASDDMSAIAEINHYPMPDKVLKYKKELNLTPVQIKKITEIESYMHRRRLQIGGSIISNEKTLDSLFKYKKINEGSLIFYTNRYGNFQGELKNAILFACYSTQKLLSAQQIAKLETLLKG